MKMIMELMAKAAMKAAVAAAGAASDWSTYQPKEPAILKTLVK